MAEVVVSQTPVQVVVEPTEPGVVSLISPGPQGPVGGATKIDVASAGTWVVPHGLGRPPITQVCLASGEVVMADVFVDNVNVTVVHAVPTAGFLNLL